MIEAIIFDMDGVLVDSEPIHTKIEKLQFLMNGLTIYEEEHQQFLGTAADAMWKKIAERHVLKIPIEELIEQNRTESLRFFDELAEIPVMPGLIELLEKLKKKNYPMAVASSSFPEIIDLILVKTGLKEYFQVIVSGEEAGKSKPEPDVFLLAALKLGVNPKNCLVIEDSKNGIKAAQAAGMICVAYQSPGVDPKTQKEADAVIRSYEQLEMMF
jgi:HAD superfamily hydrolase (TIGR01509 family)